MMISSPQFLYMILVLPTIFGMALIGEGLNKIIHEDWSGILSVVVGLVFMGIVVIAYIFYTTYVASGV